MGEAPRKLRAEALSRRIFDDTHPLGTFLKLPVEIAIHTDDPTRTVDDKNPLNENADCTVRGQTSQNGSESRERFRIRSADLDRALVMCEDGPLLLLAVDPQSCQILDRMKLCDKTWVHPAQAGGRFYVRGKAMLCCYDMEPSHLQKGDE
jgi:hypothetical protein